jgi:predicted phosphodiesterase
MPHLKTAPNSTYTRRAVLATAGAATSLTLFPRALRAHAPNRRKLTFAVVTDTHLGHQGKTTAATQWEKTAAELAESDAEIVLHLGDVVDGGREAQYPIYRATRERIGKPVHEIPGNHDPAELFEKHLRRPIDTVVELDWLRLLLVGNARTDSHDGFLSEQQLAWLDDQCTAAGRDQRSVILAMHVPVHANKHPDRGWYVKPDHGQKAFYDLLTRHAATVLSAFHGHFHNGLRGWDDHPPVHEVVFPSALYNLDRKLEQQHAPGYNLPEFRPGYTLVTLDGAKCQLAYKPVGAAVEQSKSLGLGTVKS